MRYAVMTLALAAVAGCMQYDDGYGPRASADQVPPGKIWVQDAETGEFVLVDDPNAQEQAPELSPPPAPRARVPLPPSPRQVANRARASVLPPPAPGIQPLPAGRPRPKFSISAEIWAMEAEGTASGHPDWPTEDADLADDLDLDSAFAVSLEASLQLPSGPRFRVSLTDIEAEGDRAPYIVFPAGEPIEPSAISITMADFAFTPMARGQAWGTIAMDIGLRYAAAWVEIFDEQRFVEGTMLTLGGELTLTLQRKLLFGDISASVGLGVDAADLQFDAGISLRPSPVFGMRLGYRFLGLVLADRLDEPGERRLGLSLGGPTLEMGFTF